MRMLAVTLLAACAAAWGATERAEAARLTVGPHGKGVTVRIVRTPPRAVVFVLRGKRLLLDRRAPYRVVVPGFRRAGSRSGAVRLTVRDARTGRLLGRVWLKRKPRPAQPAAAPAAPVTPAAPAAPGADPRADPAAPVANPSAPGDPGPAPAPTPAAPAPAPTPAPAAPQAAVQAPAAPGGYEVPGTAVLVSSTSGLLAALAAEGATDIVLADGVYDGSAPFLNPNGHRLYAASPGGAVLKAGLVLGGNWGPGNGLVRGLVLDVEDPGKTLHNSLVHVWGTGRGSRILDVVLRGHGVVGSGIRALQVEGLVVQRIVATDFTDFGVAVDANDPNASVSTPALIEDVDVARVARPSPGSSNGTAEACVWVGNTAVVRRIRARSCGWEGLWSGTAASGALFEHVDVADSGIGVYLEHFTTRSTFQHMKIGPNVRTGLVCEWADPSWGGRPGCVDNVVQDSVFETSLVGVYFDEGTTRTTVRRSSFRGQRWAAIGDFKGQGNLFDVAGNDYAGVSPGAVPVSPDHLPSGS